VFYSKFHQNVRNSSRPDINTLLVHVQVVIQRTSNVFNPLKLKKLKILSICSWCGSISTIQWNPHNTYYVKSKVRSYVAYSHYHM